MRWVGLALIVSCIDSRSVRCPNGSACVEGSTCIEYTDIHQATRYACALPDQFGECGSDGSSCTYVGPGVCLGGACLPVRCGDERLDPTETCGYSMDAQLQLYKDVKKNFEVPIIPVLNKSDANPKAPTGLKNYLVISAKERTGLDTLTSLLLDLSRQNKEQDTNEKVPEDKDL